MPKSDLHIAFCENIRRRRKTMRLTQQQVADRLDVSQPYVAELEAGRHAPTLNLVQRYADVLDVSAEKLLRPVKVLQAAG